MGRRALPPRLQLYGPDNRYGAKPRRGFKRYIYYIIDGRNEHPTGAEHHQPALAASALANYVRAEAHPVRKQRIEYLPEALAEYAEHRAPEIASVAVFKAAAKAALDVWGNIRIEDIDKARCTDYVRARRATTTRFGKPFALSTIKTELVMIRTAINYCVDAGYCEARPKITLPSGVTSRERHLTRKQVAALLRASRTLRTINARRRMALMILIAVYTGARMEAIASLRFTQAHGYGYIDLEAGVIDFRRHGMPQTKKRRAVVPIPLKLRAVLEAAVRRGGDWLFPAKGTDGFAGSPHKAFKKLCSKAGLPDVHFHDLSHTAVTWLAARRIHPAYISKITGKSEKIINSVYLHVVDDEMIAAINSRPHPVNQRK